MSQQQNQAWRRASLSDITSRELHSPDMVTVVIQHEVAPASVSRYEEWINRIIPVAARFPGHRGVSVIRPSGDARCYTVTLRFDSVQHAEDWLASDARGELVQELAPLLERPESIDTVTGIEFWFVPPAGAPQKRAPPHKQFLVTLSAIYPLTLLVPLGVHRLVDPWLPWRSALLVQLLIAALIVWLMTYVIMPRYTRLVARWLYA
jgi:antibiotic biosynthesis monooxygenase (ABM) superfamily enzyme